MASPSLTLQPSVDDYVGAFDSINVTAKQRAMLEFHHAAPGRAVSATTLASAVGFSNYTSANLQYGKLAGHVAGALGLVVPEHVLVGVLVTFVYPDQAKNEQFLWVMRERVALALEELGWVPKVSQYLYPDLAMKALAEDG
ncbi:hypothetical protein [Terrabacter tumescens]|nr:hypothetical protein [Terrabacter tumescens]